MKIHLVEATNFLSYRYLNYKYSNQGLTHVEGFDEDFNVSTGSGKSAFIDVISYGFFGAISKDIAADEVINRQEKKNLSVLLDFEDEGKQYRICRYRKHEKHGNDLVLISDGVEIRGKDVRETQKIIEDLIGCNIDIFNSAVYFSQFSKMDRFLSATDGEKKALIGEICDLSYYDKALEKMKKEAQTLEKSSAALSVSLQQLELQKNFYIQKSSESKLRFQQWEKSQQSKIEKIKADGINYSTYLLNKKAGVDFLIQTAEKQIEILTIRSQEKLAPVSFELEKKTLVGKLDLIGKLEAKRVGLWTDSMVLRKEIAATEEKISSELKKLNSNANSTCPWCYATVSAIHIQKHIDQLKTEVQEKKSKVDPMLKSIAQIEEGVKQKPALLARDREIVSLEAQAQHSANQLALMKTQITTLQATIAEKNKDILALASAKNPHDDILASALEEKNPFGNEDEDYTNQIHNLKTDILSGQEILASTTADFVMASWWKDALSVYVRSYLMDSFIDQINVQANEYLKILFDGVLQISISSTTDKGKETKEKISVTIMNGDEECSYDSLSGGERCRICLAVNLAISDLTCKMSRKSFNILMMDEIFTGLDEPGKNQTMKLLKELEAKFDTIFVIDHTEGFKSMFTNTVTVKKRGGISYVC